MPSHGKDIRSAPYSALIPLLPKEKKWDTLYKFAMYGQTEKVLELLLLHSRFSDLEWHPVYPKTQISERLVHGQFGSDKDDKLFHQLRLLLQTKPTFSGNTQHHSALVNNWKKEVERFLSSRSLSKEPEIKELLKILAGHQSVIESHANSWIERLCAQVNYSHPLMTLGEFRSFIEGNQLQEVEPNSVDRVFTDIMQGKTREVLNFIYRTGAWWFSAHLADLLYHAGVVSPIEVDGETERERVILEYSASLMHNEGLVHLVSSYLHYGCPFRGTVGNICLVHYRFFQLPPSKTSTTRPDTTRPDTTRPRYRQPPTTIQYGVGPRCHQPPPSHWFKKVIPSGISQNSTGAGSHPYRKAPL
eukprot:TRINITY_DN2337_c0_g1_i17.p1 TRINITY_DN2337_c0_g1~~TRINITY_DN2337_c0_g1_i17.p1  ORF type:complete len:359 (+),score=51.53 TRINITY_DN2337_c0_g1_i17:847-1923(+)